MEQRSASTDECSDADAPGGTRVDPQPPRLLGRSVVRAILWLGNVHRRLMAVYFGVIGPDCAYRVTGALARLLYRLLDPIRLRSEAQCRAALGERLPAEEVARVAERAFVHRVWDVVDLMLADRYLHPNTYQRYGGRIGAAHLDRLLAVQRRGQAAILVTGYYGPFDLLPLFLGYNGAQAGVVYRRHKNAGFDAYRSRIRGRGRCELIPVDRASDRLGAILAAGGTVALVADHHAEGRGLPVTFLGLPTRAMRSVGLLAWRYDADVLVAGIRRVGEAFRFEFVVADVLDHRDWQRETDPVDYITRRYLRALEAIVLEDPSQYLWGYARWGETLARELVIRDLANQDEPGHDAR